MTASPLIVTCRSLRCACLLLAVTTGAYSCSATWASAAEDASAVERRLSEAAKYLASDELEGRGIGTEGINTAADYIAQQLQQMQLKTDLYAGQPFQKFKMSTGATQGANNALKFVAPGKDGAALAEPVELKLGQDFTPLAMGGSGKFDLPLVFAGYGITGKEENYDDYAGIDVKDKAVIILRHEPQQANPHSAFNGTDNSKHAPYVRKVSNAYEHGAGAVIFVTDHFDLQSKLSQHRKRWQTAVDQFVEENAKFKALDNPTEEQWKAHEQRIEKLTDEIKSLTEQITKADDPLIGFEGAGAETEGRNFPVLFCRRTAIDPVVKASLGKDLAQLEEEIDKGPAPVSAPLADWRAVGQTDVQRTEVEVKNVVAVLEGEGPRADETIVIGAHYDHLGYGGTGSGAPGVHEIHNGADDNGSGTAALIEVARELSSRAQKLPRRVVFIAFTGEERGLIGSARYVREPLVPLADTIAMLNMDMVGRLQDDKLIVYGTGTASLLDSMVDRLGKEYGFAITKKPEGFGPSDHSSFYSQKIPVLHFFTGSHKDYHRPSDDFEKLNIGGMRRVAQMVAQFAVELAEAPERPQYLETKQPSALRGGGDRPYFGSIPDFSQEQPGYALTGVTKDGPAERAGIRAGDIIVQLGDSRIGNLEDFDSALRKHKASDKVPVTVKRGSESLKFDVILDPPR